MTLAIADRLFETTVTTGNGPFTLQGAVAGFQGFATLGNGAKTTFYIDDADATTGIVQKWIDAIGTVTVAGNVTTLSVDQVLASSNNGSPVNFGSGTKNVRGGLGAKVLPITDENLNDVRHYAVIPQTGNTANAHAVTLPYTPLAYSDGMQIVYRVAATNTTAGATVNVNGLGAKALKINGANPGIGVLPAGALVVAFYKASNDTFELINPNAKNNIDLTSEVNGVLPVANGGTGVNSSKAILQRASFYTGAVATGTALVPADDTVPQITEGNEYMSLSFTPKSATSKLVIEVIGCFSNTAANQVAMSLFQDSVLDALKTAFHYLAAAYVATIPLRHEMVSGTTSPITFRVRAGGNSAGTTTFNGQTSARLYGGVLTSNIQITEYAA